MTNGNGGMAGWAKFTLGLLVTVGLFAAGILVGEIRESGGMNARLNAIESELGKGRRWTLEQQLEYMDEQAQAHQKMCIEIAEIKVMVRALCTKTNADC